MLIILVISHNCTHMCTKRTGKASSARRLINLTTSYSTWRKHTSGELPGPRTTGPLDYRALGLPGPRTTGTSEFRAVTK